MRLFSLCWSCVAAMCTVGGNGAVFSSVPWAAGIVQEEAEVGKEE